MTATYVAWNGKSYPSPPPDGWYEASDARWWAPGTGPNPPKITATSATANPSQTGQANGTKTTAATAGERAAQDVTATRTTVEAQAGMPAKTSAASVAATQSTASAERAPTEPAETAETATIDREQSTVLTKQRALESDPAVTEHPHSDRPARDEDSQPAAQPSDKPKHKKRDFVLVGIVAFGLVAAAGFAYLAFGLPNDDGDDVATSTDTAASTTAPSAVAASPSTAQDVADDESAATEATSSSAATSTTDTSASTASSSTATSTASETTTTEAPPVTIASQEELVSAFRARLDANDLSGEQLTAADIIDFGNSFCTFAIISDDAEAFDVYRQKVLDESTGELTAEELSVAIDEAITVFCPQHAQRLGIA